MRRKSCITDNLDSAFAFCPCLEKITVDDSEDGERGKAVIPEGVTHIGTETFLGRERLAEIALPSSLESLGDYALKDCVNLRKIELPEGLARLGKGAFLGCENLE